MLPFQPHLHRFNRNLNTGGFAEFQDLDILLRSDDGSLTEDSHTGVWNRVLIEGCERAGIEHSPGPKLGHWLKEAGFVNVTSRIFRLPLGPWPKDKHLKEVGCWNLQQVLDGLEAFTLYVACEVLGWSKEEVTVLLANVRKEMTSPKIHVYYNL